MPGMRNISIITLIFLTIIACTTTQRVASPDEQFASMYNPSEFSLNADYEFFHLNDGMTSMYIRLFPGELLYNQANDENEYRALVQIAYEIFLLDEEGMMIQKTDSSDFTINLGRETEDKSAYFSSKVLPILGGKRYLIRLEAKDLQRGTLGLKHLYIDKLNEFSAQNFSIVSGRSGFPKFQNYMMPGELFRLKYRAPGIETLYLDFYKSDGDLPRPIVTQNSASSFPRIPDTTMVLNYNETQYFSLPDEGMYHFRIDSLRTDGVTINHFGEDFPQVKTEKALFEPLFYLTTQSEFKRLQQSENLKLAVDDFWLKRASSKDRSRELIRVYYNRVLYSNLYFTSDREGWKTDRGMVFILFGPPDRMRDSGIEQRWYYISRRQNKVIEFVFERKANEFTNSDLIWRKNIESMQYWSSAVSSWRAGKVYTLGK